MIQNIISKNNNAVQNESEHHYSVPTRTITTTKKKIKLNKTYQKTHAVCGADYEKFSKIYLKCS